MNGISGRRKPGSLATLLGMLAGAAMTLLVAGEVGAQGSHTNRRGSVSSPGLQRHSTGSPGAARTNTVPRANPNRHLLPPAGLGSAANAPPGFYQRLNAPERSSRGHGHHGPVYLPYPYLVYVDSLDYAVSPWGEPPPPEPAPQPQPIVIVQQAPSPPPPAPEPEAPRPVVPAPAPAPKEPTAVAFSIHPLDATVFLDDERLGTGEELAELTSALILPPGVYVLEVEHPDFRAQRLVFGVGAGEPVEVVVDLATDRAGRRTRIR